MSFDPEVANSGGFFKDPVTKQWLTGNEPRVVEGHIDEKGKYIVPQVKLSDGSVGKLVFRFWSAKEKELYKIYREGSKAKAQLATTHSHVEQPKQAESAVTQVKVQNSVYDRDVGTASASTKQYIATCNCTYGVWMMDGVTYELLGKRGVGSYIPIPRSLIPYADRERIGIPK